MTTNPPKVDVWMKLVIGDFVADTLDFSRDEIGSYLLLTMAYWRNKGPLPDDDQGLKTICRCPDAQWARTKGVLARKFTIKDGAWHHKRIEAELAKAMESRESLSDRGYAGAMARWGAPDGQSNAQALPKQCQADAKPMLENAPSPSPSPSPSESPSHSHSEGRACDFSEVIKELCNLYGRPNRMVTYAEESQLAELARIGDIKAELAELLAYRATLKGDEVRFFPNSIASLVVKWHSTLDKARTQSGAKRIGPTLNEVLAVAKEKWGNDPAHPNWAASFHSFWSKRNWLRQGRPIEWREEFGKQVGKWRKSE